MIKDVQSKNAEVCRIRFGEGHEFTFDVRESSVIACKPDSFKTMNI